MREAIISAIVGAVVGGFIAYVTAVRITQQQIQANLQLERIGRSWATISGITPILGQLLAAYTAEKARGNRELVFNLEEEYEIHTKSAFIEGKQTFARELWSITRDYRSALHDFALGKFPKEELDRLRIRTRAEVAEAIARHE